MLSIPDMALLGAAALIFFGPEQLPKVARKVGLVVRDIQNTSQTFIREMERAADEPGPDISRAHLVDEPAYAPPVHEAYVPPAHDQAYEPPLPDEVVEPPHEYRPEPTHASPGHEPPP
jgi:sec-independent protein translocase protein TatA